jgi:hypothetical protein
LDYLKELTEHAQSLKDSKKSKKKEKIQKKKEEADNNIEDGEKSKSKLKKVFPEDLEKCEKLIKNLKSKITKHEAKLKTRVINIFTLGRIKTSSLRY